MKINWAIKQLLKGKKVTRKEFSNKVYYYIAMSTVLKMTTVQGTIEHGVFTQADLEADNWILKE